MWGLREPSRVSEGWGVLIYLCPIKCPKTESGPWGRSIGSCWLCCNTLQISSSSDRFPTSVLHGAEGKSTCFQGRAANLCRAPPRRNTPILCLIYPSSTWCSVPQKQRKETWTEPSQTSVYYNLLKRTVTFFYIHLKEAKDFWDQRKNMNS